MLELHLVVFNGFDASCGNGDWRLLFVPDAENFGSLAGRGVPVVGAVRYEVLRSEASAGAEPEGGRWRRGWRISALRRVISFCSSSVLLSLPERALA